MNSKTIIQCACCGKELPEEWLQSMRSHSHFCPKCGSSKKRIILNDEDCIEIHEWLTGKIKDKSYNSKKNPRYEFIKGDDLRKDDVKWMKKDRVIDKYNDNYMEEVTDPETGEVVHKCEEKLSDHFGHGSAKFNKSWNVDAPVRSPIFGIFPVVTYWNYR